MTYLTNAVQNEAGECCAVIISVLQNVQIKLGSLVSHPLFILGENGTESQGEVA